MENVYFALTKELNREGTIAVLTSGQAAVYYRTAIMSKDGDWVLEETPEANAFHEEDRRRLERYESASRAYLEALIRSRLLDPPLQEAHRAIVHLAGRLLPARVAGEGDEAP